MHDCIGTHLDDTPGLNRLAEIASLSPFHWQRVYRSLYGGSIVLTVRRMRIVRVPEDLVGAALSLGAPATARHMRSRVHFAMLAVCRPRSTGAPASTGRSIRYSEERKTCSNMKSRSGGCRNCAGMRLRTRVRT
nr:hypothetical protein [Burkholderia anthina]